MPGYDEFVDPNSAIARIIAQMQGAATRSNPDAMTQQRLQGDLRPGGAQPGPVGTGPEMYQEMGPPGGGFQGEMGPEDPNELIARLLQGQMGR